MDSSLVDLRTQGADNHLGRPQSYSDDTED